MPAIYPEARPSLLSKLVHWLFRKEIKNTIMLELRDPLF